MLGPGETKGMTERREPCSYNLMESAYKRLIKQTVRSSMMKEAGHMQKHRTRACGASLHFHEEETNY